MGKTQSPHGRIAKRVANAKPSVMGGLIVQAQEMRSTGKPLIDLAAGVPDYAPPRELISAAERAIRFGQNSYGDARGIPQLRKALAESFAENCGAIYDADSEVTVTAGASAALTSALLALVDPGDTVALFEPFFEQYADQIRLCGASPKFISLRPPAWRFSEQMLERALAGRTKVLILNTPHNPTGRVFNRSELEMIARLCAKHDVMVISDETYSTFAFDTPHVSICTVPEMRSRTLTLTSISKTLNVSGWRIGSVFAPADLTDALRRVNNLALGAPVPLQEACARVLASCNELLSERREEMLIQRNDLCTALLQAGMRPCVPEGTMSLLCDASALPATDDREACAWLLANVGILATPASAFFAGNKGRTYVRFSFARHPTTILAAGEALRRIPDLLRGY